MDALGINPILLIAQIISFSVLLFLLNKFLYRKIRKSLDDRREAVKKSVLLETETQKRLKQIEENESKREKKNQFELRALREEAKKTAEQLKKQILVDADKKGQKIIEQAKEQIEREKSQAEEDLRNQAKLLATEITEKVLQEKSSNNAWQKKEFERSISALEKLKI